MLNHQTEKFVMFLSGPDNSIKRKIYKLGRIFYKPLYVGFYKIEDCKKLSNNNNTKLEFVKEAYNYFQMLKKSYSFVDGALIKTLYFIPHIIT